MRDFVAAQGERRFFLHVLTVSSHHPYGLKGKSTGERLSDRYGNLTTLATNPNANAKPDPIPGPNPGPNLCPDPDPTSNPDPTLTTATPHPYP